MRLTLNLCHFLHKKPPSRSRSFCSSLPIDFNALKVVFFGTDSFSIASLDLLQKEYSKSDGKIKVLDVVTSFKALKNPVKSFAQENGLQCFDFRNFHLTSGSHDLGLVVSFGHLLPSNLINSFPLGILNVHASLLPKLRGAAPIVHAIRKGQTKTGVTIMKIEPKHFDIGDVLLQSETHIGPHELMPQVHDRLASIGAQLLLTCIRDLPNCLQNAKKQNNEDASYAPKIDEDFIRVRWESMTARDVYNLYRSLYSFKFPVTMWNKEIVKLKEMTEGTGNISDEGPPGFVRFLHKNRTIAVTCADGREIEIKSLGIGKKKQISALDFKNGFLRKIPEIERKFI